MCALRIIKQLENPICVYDFTSFLEVPWIKIKELLVPHCKKWSFQREKCPSTGKLHYQGRFSLKQKARLRLPFCERFKNFRLSATSKENRDNDFYVTKEDSRHEGPWTDKDEEIYIPRDIRAISELRPWQNTCIEMLKTYDPRVVDVLYDERGNSGKSTLTRWCMCHKIARKLPFVNDFKDIMRMVMDMPTAGAYIIDMPRAVKKDRLFQLYAGIEEVKGGYAYDDRYHFKEKIFDPPRVLVFTNNLPDETLLSRDRWRIWCIENSQLVRYNPNQYDDIGGL